MQHFHSDAHGLIAHGIYPVLSPGGDGLTSSIWRDDAAKLAAMLAAAYGDGAHRVQLEACKNEHITDRTSFTRTRLLRSAGDLH